MRLIAGDVPSTRIARQPVLEATLAGRMPLATRSEEQLGLPALDRAAAGAHARRVLRVCLDELPERYRTVLWLSDVERQSVQDVAAALDITIPLATARLARARHMLSKALCRVCRPPFRLLQSRNLFPRTASNEARNTGGAHVTCREFADFIADYLSDELPPAARRTFERHLERCDNCQTYLAIYRETIRLGRRAFDGAEDARVPADVPERLLDAILAAMRADRGRM